MPQLILASGSPGRKALLESAHVAFTVDASNYEEDMSLDMPPRDLAMFLSQGKARDVAKRYANASEDMVILAADSFAVFDGQLLGKPHTPERAKEMLTMLSGQTHTFITGFTIIDARTGREHQGAAETKVYFRTISSQDIDNYLAKENVLEKAAAYVVQGLGAAFIDKIEGDYSNIVGLPLAPVAVALKTFNIDLLN